MDWNTLSARRMTYHSDPGVQVDRGICMRCQTTQQYGWGNHAEARWLCGRRFTSQTIRRLTCLAQHCACVSNVGQLLLQQRFQLRHFLLNLTDGTLVLVKLAGRLRAFLFCFQRAHLGSLGLQFCVDFLANTGKNFERGCMNAYLDIHTYMHRCLPACMHVCKGNVLLNVSPVTMVGTTVVHACMHACMHAWGKNTQARTNNQNWASCKRAQTNVLRSQHLLL